MVPLVGFQPRFLGPQEGGQGQRTDAGAQTVEKIAAGVVKICLLYTSDAADE